MYRIWHSWLMYFTLCVDAYIGLYSTVSFDFHEIVFISYSLSKLIYVYEQNEAGKNMGLRAQIANQNLKRNKILMAINFFLRYIWH